MGCACDPDPDGEYPCSLGSLAEGRPGINDAEPVAFSRDASGLGGSVLLGKALRHLKSSTTHLDVVSCMPSRILRRSSIASRVTWSST